MKNPTLEYLFQTRPENLKDWTEEDEEKFISDLGELLNDSTEEATNDFFLPYFKANYTFFAEDSTSQLDIIIEETDVDDIQCEMEVDDD